MSIASDLAAAREAAVELLTDTVQVWRRSGSTTDDLGTERPSWVLVYEGPGLVQRTTSLRDPLAMAGAGLADVSPYVVKVPIGTGIDRDDLTIVVASLSAPHIGHAWTVSAIVTQGWQLLMRCQCDPADELLGQVQR